MKGKFLPDVIYNISGVRVLKKFEPNTQICRRCAASVLVAENIILRCQESEEYFQFQLLQEGCLQGQQVNPTSACQYTNERESPRIDYEEYCSGITCDDDFEESLNWQPRLADSKYQTKSKSIKENISDVVNCEDNLLRNSAQYEPEAKTINNIETTTLSMFSCDQCDYSTKVGKRIIEHKQTDHGVHDPNIYACTICSERFSWKPTLYRHIELIHKTLPADKKFLCNECGRAYMREVHLIEHIKQRHGPRKFKCPDPLCEQSFTRTFTLRRHFITTHTEKTSTRYHCVDCDKYFKVYDQWKYHNEVVHKNEIVYCPHCGYPFRFKEKLEEHLQKDVCKRSVVPCSYCQRRFTTKSGLREHVRNIHNIY
ncbi:unnamed protein product [Ceratitis capitata]|nr:unnamed protein product [Ceratitis capitata]